MVKSEPIVDIKEEFAENNDDSYGDDDESYSDNHSPPLNLPLEIITSIKPHNNAYPQLKNMSNGVLTHRNIFIEEEREVLRKIVERYRDIVDARSRTREIYVEKQNVWQQIVEEYNSTVNISIRTEKELKKCWDNMKYRARLAEKEQQRSDHLLDNGFELHNIASNAVNAVLNTMLQSQFDSNQGDNSHGILNNENKALDASDVFDDEPEISVNEENGYNDISSSEELDDEQPVLKKARQESPKLSSILLGDAKKSSYFSSEASNVSVKHNSSYPKFLQNCGGYPNASSSNTVSILPKSLFNSSVSVTNIPNPNSGLNSFQQRSEIAGVSDDFNSLIYDNGSLSHESGHSSSVSISNGGPIPIKSNGLSLKPMPFLTKMQSSKTYKQIKNMNIPCSSMPSSANGFDEIEHGTSPPHNSSKENLEMKVLHQRLDIERREHEMKMKVLEKQLQAFSNESRFWFLKAKLLKNGQNRYSVDGVNGSA